HNYQKNGQTYHILLLCYLCTFIGGVPRPLECHDMRWVGPREIEGFDFAAADIPVAEKVRTRLWGGGG
ncbi:MAG: hypothetical protein NT045_00915, partial [Candidatus Aureabacteria bacterium]|nr:hypothetical protein [Candidatus Auribacterota bacterium]